MQNVIVIKPRKNQNKRRSVQCNSNAILGFTSERMQAL